MGVPQLLFAIAQQALAKKSANNTLGSVVPQGAHLVVVYCLQLCSRCCRRGVIRRSDCGLPILGLRRPGRAAGSFCLHILAAGGIRSAGTIR